MNDLTPRETYWIERWAQALRTTTAPQIYRHLRDDTGGRCAIGVLVDVLAMDGLTDWDRLDVSAEPCTEVVRCIAPGSFKAMGVLTTVTKLNDVLSVPFPDIADWLNDLLPRDAVPAVAEQDAVAAV